MGVFGWGGLVFCVGGGGGGCLFLMIRGLGVINECCCDGLCKEENLGLKVD